MKLAYITNVKIPACDAQNIQVQAMCKVFFEKLNNNFILISPKNKKNKDMSRGYRWYKINVFLFLPRFLRYMLLILLSFSKVLRFKPNIIYSRDIGVIYFYKIFGYKVVYEIHKPFETKIGNLIFRLIAKKVKIITISQALKDFVIEKYHLDSKNILVAHDGVFLEKYESLNKKFSKEKMRKELGLFGNKFIVVYSSNLYKGKGLELVIEAAKKNKDCIFIIIGSRGKNQLKENPFPKNIRHIGRRKMGEIPEYLVGADALIIPFTKELKTWKYHSALKSFEYMASKTPIITSNIGSLNEIFNEGNSYMFDPASVDDFVKKINMVRFELEKSNKKAMRSFEDVKNYTWQKRCDNILIFLFS